MKAYNDPLSRKKLTKRGCAEQIARKVFHAVFELDTLDMNLWNIGVVQLSIFTERDWLCYVIVW